MKIAVLLLAALAATGCMGRSTSSGSGTASGATALTVSISGSKQDRVTMVWTLICPSRGTLPHARSACTRLDAMKDPFAPVPKGVACTQIYGGPEIADVRGRFRGRQISAKFSRRDGCEIARWNKVRFLFPES